MTGESVTVGGEFIVNDTECEEGIKFGFDVFGASFRFGLDALLGSEEGDEGIRGLWQVVSRGRVS